MTDPKHSALHQHITAVKKGERVFENAFQSVSRMILEKEINKVTVNGKEYTGTALSNLVERIETLELRLDDAEMTGTPRDLFLALATYPEQVDAAIKLVGARISPTEAARQLGIGRSTIYREMRRLGVERPA